MLTNDLKLEDKVHLRELFPFACKSLDEGFEYLGFVLNPNSYHFEDWI